MGTDEMFPHEGDVKGIEHARATCAGCPVRDTCLHTVFHEITGPKQTGVWGGSTYDDREQTLRAVANRKRNEANKSKRTEGKG
jgi:hypothetical protein